MSFETHMHVHTPACVCANVTARKQHTGLSPHGPRAYIRTPGATNEAWVQVMEEERSVDLSDSDSKELLSCPERLDR